jgi:hypothetical protein
MGLKERIKINPPIWFKALSDAVGLYKEWKQGKVALLADHFVAAYQARLLPAEAISQKQTEETKV